MRGKLRLAAEKESAICGEKTLRSRRDHRERVSCRRRQPLGGGNGAAAFRGGRGRPQATAGLAAGKLAAAGRAVRTAFAPLGALPIAANVRAALIMALHD